MRGKKKETGGQQGTGVGGTLASSGRYPLRYRTFWRSNRLEDGVSHPEVWSGWSPRTPGVFRVCGKVSSLSYRVLPAAARASGGRLRVPPSARGGGLGGRGAGVSDSPDSGGGIGGTRAPMVARRGGVGSRFPPGPGPPPAPGSGSRGPGSSRARARRGGPGHGRSLTAAATSAAAARTSRRSRSPSSSRRRSRRADGSGTQRAGRGNRSRRSSKSYSFLLRARPHRAGPRQSSSP